MPEPAQTRRALVRADRGQSLDVDDIAALLAARGEALEDLLAIASRLRDQGLDAAGRPGIVTYSPKVFIPLTRLCRDSCHYCTFATHPAQLRAEGQPMFLEMDEVVRIAQAGADAGCLEALFTLGDRPEDRWPAAGEWLAERGYASTMEYVRAAAIAVIEHVGLLPHLNPGVMTWQDLISLRPVAPSMGMMLETTSERLFSTPGQVHYGSPDKDPRVRLRTLTDAGRAAVPFTTGLLVGIGETLIERAESLLAIRASAREFGHVQEVIIQNFRAKADTALRSRADLSPAEHHAAIATARVVLGPGVRIQVPPNLAEPDDLVTALRAGADDWGGVSPVTPDHVNPERPWPDVDVLREVSASAGFTLRARLTVHPEYVRGAERWIDPGLHALVATVAAEGGLARADAHVRPQTWQARSQSYAEFAEAAGLGRSDLYREIDITGRTNDRRTDFGEVYGSWDAIAEQARDTGGAPVHRPAGSVLSRALRLAADDPAALGDARHQPEAVALAKADGSALQELACVADALRSEAVGDDVTYVVNRNVNFTNVCYTGCRFCAFAQRERDPDAFTLSLDEVQARVRDAVAAGATEICMQGGIHPGLPASSYFDLAEAVKAAAGEVHLHAFSPMEVVSGAGRLGVPIREFLERLRRSGVDSIPGTAAEILDDEVRWVLTKGKLPSAAWIEVIEAAHAVGLPSSATMMYGHVDRPEHWVQHLRVLREVAERDDASGAPARFTEFVGLPFVHQNAPVYLAGIARAGSTVREDIATTALARLMLYPYVVNVQASWVKLGDDGAAALLRAGANDLGGTLMEETISRMAGSSHGSSRTPEQLVAVAASVGRPARQRSTTYAAAVR